MSGSGNSSIFFLTAFSKSNKLLVGFKKTFYYKFSKSNSLGDKGDVTTDDKARIKTYLRINEFFISDLCRKKCSFLTFLDAKLLITRCVCTKSI